MTLSPHIRKSRQAGVTLVEVTMTLGILALMAFGITNLLGTDRKDLALATVAGRIAEVRAASDRYIRDNFTSLETATGTGPVTISVDTLRGQDYLPSGFTNQNEFRQTLQVYVRQRAPGVLESIVVASGGTPMTAAEGGKVALLLKGAGGFVPVGADTAVGTKGGWRVALAGFIPGGAPRPNGHPVSYALNRRYAGPSGALMRDATGNLIDNQMNTDLDMNFHRILNVKDLAVGGETINNTTVRNINDLAGVNCQEGQALTKVAASFMCVSTSGVPTNGVVAVLGSCPAGWRHDARFAGRILIGSGTYEETVGGITRSYTYAMGDTGGQSHRALTVDELPAHSHKTITTGTAADWEVRSGSMGGTVRSWSDTGGDQEYSLNTTPQEANVGDSQTVGGGQPVDTRQPYYAVNYCLKN